MVQAKRLNPDRPWKARRDRFGRRHSPCRFWRVRLHFGSNREPTEPLRRLPWNGDRDRRCRDQLHRRRRGGGRFSAGIRSLNQDARADAPLSGFEPERCSKAARHRSTPNHSAERPSAISKAAAPPASEPQEPGLSVAGRRPFSHPPAFRGASRTCP